MPSNQTWKQMHIQHLKHRYQRKAEQWKDITTDDRLVYCNLYRMILRALDSLPDTPDNYVCVAMNSKMEEDRQTLDEIAAVFADR